MIYLFIYPTIRLSVCLSCLNCGYYNFLHWKSAYLQIFWVVIKKIQVTLHISKYFKLVTYFLDNMFQYFTYRISTKECFLKWGKETNLTDADYISGPQNCNANAKSKQNFEIIWIFL